MEDCVVMDVAVKRGQWRDGQLSKKSEGGGAHRVVRSLVAINQIEVLTRKQSYDQLLIRAR